MMVQLSTPYADPERQNAQCHRQTDRQTDGHMTVCSMMLIANPML